MGNTYIIDDIRNRYEAFKRGWTAGVSGASRIASFSAEPKEFIDYFEQGYDEGVSLRMKSLNAAYDRLREELVAAR